MGETFGLHLFRCGPRVFGVKVWCYWRKIMVLQLVVPKVKIMVKKGTSLSFVYCICIVYYVFFVFFCQYVVGCTELLFLCNYAYSLK